MKNELRELEIWLAANVMGQAWFRSQNRSLSVLEKCAERCDQISMTRCGSWAITEGDGNDDHSIEAEAETLPLAIAKFAKLIFSEDKA